MRICVKMASINCAFFAYRQPGGVNLYRQAGNKTKLLPMKGRRRRMEIKEAAIKLVQNGIEKLVLSSPKSKSYPYRKMTVRPLLIQKQNMYQLERFTEKQAFQENIKPEELVDALVKSLTEEFSQLDGWSQKGTHLIKVSKKGKVLYKEKIEENCKPCTENAEEDTLFKPQNRQKKYLLEAKDAPQPLVDLGVVTKEGKVVASRYDKYKQINRFIEMIDNGIEPRVKRLNIIDFGCGKSYLTFVLYHYLVNVRHIDAHVVGLDLKADVIEKCNAIAKRYGYENLRFEVGDVNGYKADFQVDMVITLHACDTATDFALFNAIRWNTPRIYSVPCCQHELCQQMKRQTAGSLTEYGLIKERFAALLTDALRADLLKAQGYQVDLLEFVDMEHSPKNLLIRAVKETHNVFSAPGASAVSAKESARSAKQRVEEAMNEYHVKPTLYHLLYGEGSQE